MPGKLYLIPSPISDCDLDWVIPYHVRRLIQQLDYFIVEHPKTVRRFLKQVECKLPLQDIQMAVLNEHTRPHELESFLQPLLSGRDAGLLSEAGCPAVADPGSDLVQQAQNNNLTVVPLVGPSSIMLALMASGLNGQRFCFHGYLPIDKAIRVQTLKTLEKQSGELSQTQIFIETPYRNQRLLELIVQTCQDDTAVCIAAQLTSSEESVITRTIQQWKQKLPEIHKIPAIFLLYRPR